MPPVDDIIRYESGEMTYDEVVEFFQELLDTGAINYLQGCYQRQMDAFVKGGVVG